MATNPIGDTADVLTAIRLGWAMAEVRARYWMAYGAPAAHVAARPAPPTGAAQSLRNFLPLGGERSGHELAIQASAMVAGLARTLRLDVDCTELSWVGDAAGTASDYLARLTRGLEQSAEAAWLRFSEFLYAWDARIQDRLAAGSFTESSGYLLGRGLAEICWGPVLAGSGDAPAAPRDWSGFLGEPRRRKLLTYLDRLAGYFHPLTAPAIRCSLSAWGEVADDPDWRAQPRTAEELNVQALVWRDLLLGQRDPESLIATNWNLGKARSGWRVFRIFWPQVLIAAIGILFLSGAAWILADPKDAMSHGLGAVLGVLGFFGVTGASLHARAKNTEQQLLARVRLTYERDLLADVATLRPAKQLVERRPYLLRHLVSSRLSPWSAFANARADVQKHQLGGEYGNDDANSQATGGVGPLENQSANR
ncbi:MAG: hypothetical protein M3003_12150 [Candidatus Dormibacteraeota bacterium]|nr:hypothetical protein [Candidatus Dormibacteraeota bacterium]